MPIMLPGFVNSLGKCYVSLSFSFTYFFLMRFSKTMENRYNYWTDKNPYWHQSVNNQLNINISVNYGVA